MAQGHDRLGTCSFASRGLGVLCGVFEGPAFADGNCRFGDGEELM